MAEKIMSKLVTWGLLLLFLTILLWGLLSPKGLLVTVSDWALSSGQSFLPGAPNPDLEGKDSTECTLAISGIVQPMEKDAQFCVNNVIYTCNQGGKVEEERCGEKGPSYVCEEKNKQFMCVDNAFIEGLPTSP